MTNMLDIDIPTLSADRALFDKAIRSVALAARVSYADAYGKLDQATKDAYDRTGAPTPPLRVILEAADVDPEFVSAGVRMLEQTDAAVQKAEKRAAKRLSAENVDGMGRVLLSADKAARILASPTKQERRLARVRAAQPGRWDGEDGRRRFL